MKHRLLQRDVLSGILLLGLCVTLWMLSAEFPSPDDGYPGAALFPRIIGICIGIMGLWLIINAFRTPRTGSSKRSNQVVSGITRFVVAIGVVASYPLLVSHVHFIPAMAVLIIIFGFLLKNKAWQAVLTATLSAFLIYSLFTHLLGVPL